MTPKTLDDIKAIVEQVTFRDWTFFVRDDGSRWYLQVLFHAPCARTGDIILQSGRKWMLSAFMTPTEIVRTCHVAVRQAIEHEMNEDFTYRGRRIAGPHISIEALWEIAEREEVRTDIGAPTV